MGSTSDTAIGVVFPGQGVQRPGMAEDFHDRFAVARHTFAEASEALAFDVAALCFGRDERLHLTQFAQPAILTAEIAMMRVLREHFGLAPACFGGHSLGEYAALVAAGAIEPAGAVRLVHVRGRLMQEAVPVGEGTMKAVIQPDLDEAVLVAALSGLAVDLANLNSPDQAVLSGRTRDLETAIERLRGTEAFARARALPLKVSAPFHSRLMEPAEQRFRHHLAESAPSWKAANAARVTSNYTGRFHQGERDALVEALARQISAPVRWLDNMRALAERCERIIEVGPGRPLRAFFAKLGVRVEPVTDVAAAERLSAGRRTG